MPKSCLLLPAVVLLGGIAAVLSAQAPEPELYFEQLDVRVVNLEVFVTDKRGGAIRDLARGDFVLFEDDREVEVTHFVAPGVADAAASTRVADAPVAGEMGRIEREPLLVVVYVDNTTLLKNRRQEVIRDLRRLAGERADDLLFMVVAYDGRLERKTGFSSDLAEIDTALEEIGEGAAEGMNQLVEYRRAVAGIQSLMASFSTTDCGPCDCGWDAMSGLWEDYARNGAARVGHTAAGLLELVRSLAGLPGRKAVVYLSSGLQKRPGVSLAAYLADLCPMPKNTLEYQSDRQLRYDETELLAALTAEANAARITLYPLQATSSAVNPGLTQLARLERESNLRAGLSFLAGETGGRDLLEADRLFDTLESDLDNRYEIAFDPARPPDGRVHAIRVELRRPRRGLELRYRRSYRDKLLEERLVDLAHTVMSLAGERNARSNPLRIDAVVHNQAAEKSGPVKAQLEVRLPLENLTRIPAGEGSLTASRVRLLVMIREPGGRLLPARQKVLEIAAGPEKVHRVLLGIDLPPGESEIVVGVRDEMADITSFLKLAAGV